jgi:hypothetical protein
VETAKPPHPLIAEEKDPFRLSDEEASEGERDPDETLQKDDLECEVEVTLEN